MATIKDVANLAGVSPAAVSKYFKTPHNMRETTRVQIEEAIQKLHFKPNPLARSLRTGRSGIIAIAIPEIDNPYFSNIFRNVQNCFTDMGYLPMMLRTSTVQEAEQAADLLKSGLMSGALCYDDGQVNALLYDDEISVPVIRLAPLTDKRDSDYSVLIDLKPGIELLCRELSSNGVATVGYIGPVDDASSSTKFEAIQEYCEKYSLSLRKDAIYTNCYGYNGGYLSCEKMLSEISLLPDAIICESDMIAMGVLKSFCHHNIRVPEDIRLSGYDNTEIAVMSNPSLTSINIPLNDICNCASEMLINLIQGKFSEDMQKHVIFSTELEVRTSTKKK